MAFDIIRGVFEADASELGGAFEEAATSHEELSSAAGDTAAALEEINGPADSATGGIEQTESAALAASGSLEEIDGSASSSSSALEGIGDSSASASGGLEDVEGAAGGASTAAGETADGFDMAIQESDSLQGTLGSTAGELEGVSGSAESTSSALEGIGGSAGSSSSALEGVGGSAGDASSSLEGVGDAGASGSGGLEEFAGSADSADGAISGADFSGSAGDLEDVGSAGSSAADGLGESASEADTLESELSDVTTEADSAAGALDSVGGAGVAAGGALAAGGVGAVKMLDSTKDMRGELNQAGLRLDATGDEMNQLARDMTDATFPMEDAVGAMGEISQYGADSTEELEKYTLAADNMADATGSSATAISQSLMPSINALDGDLTAMTEDADTFTYAVNNTSMDIDDLGSTLQKLDFSMLQDMGLEAADTASLMAKFADETGYSGRLLESNFNSALKDSNGDLNQLYDELGLSAEQMEEWENEIAEAGDVTDDYANAANDSLTITDEFTDKYDDFLMKMGASGGQVETAAIAMTGVGSTMAGISTTAPLAASAMKTLGASSYFALGPLAALAAAGVALWYVWDNDIGGIATKSREVFSSVQEYTSPLVSVLRDDLGKTITSLRGTWDSATNAFMRDTQGLRETVGPPLQTLGGIFSRVFEGAIFGAFTLARQGLALLRGDFEGMVQYGETFNQKMAELFGGTGEKVMNMLRGGINRGKQWVYDSLMGGLRDLRALLPGSDAQRGPFSDLSSVGPAIPRMIADGIRAYVNLPFKALDGMASLARKLLPGPAGDAASGALSDAASTGRYLMSGVGSGIRSFASNPIGTLKSAADSLRSILPGGGGNASTGSLTDVVSSGGYLSKGVGTGIAGSASDATSSLKSLASDLMSYLPPGASGPLGNLVSRAKNIPASIAKGIRSGAPDVRGAIGGIAGDISDRLPLSPAKKGPLRRGPEERGRIIGQDLVKGMLSESSTVASATEEIAEIVGGVEPDGSDMLRAEDGSMVPASFYDSAPSSATGGGPSANSGSSRSKTLSPQGMNGKLTLESNSGDREFDQFIEQLFSRLEGHFESREKSQGRSVARGRGAV